MSKDTSGQTKYMLKLSNAGRALILMEKLSETPLKTKDLGFIIPYSMINVLEKKKKRAYFMKIDPMPKMKITHNKKRKVRILRFVSSEASDKQ